jgi:hypothetical protein
VAPKTKYYKGTGGLASMRSVENIQNCAMALKMNYPDIVTLFCRKTTGFTEVRLKVKKAGKNIISEININGDQTPPSA